ncbi:hypothetical protein GCM10009630_15310 [Kribbella jejuensis]
MLSTPPLDAFGLEVDRMEATRPGDDESPGNGNWHLWTADGEHHILRRYHVLRTEADLIFETRVLDHLTAQGSSRGRIAGSGCFAGSGPSWRIGRCGRWRGRRSS